MPSAPPAAIRITAIAHVENRFCAGCMQPFTPMELYRVVRQVYNTDDDDDGALHWEARDACSPLCLIAVLIATEGDPRFSNYMEDLVCIVGAREDIAEATGYSDWSRTHVGLRLDAPSD